MAGIRPPRCGWRNRTATSRGPYLAERTAPGEDRRRTRNPAHGTHDRLRRPLHPVRARRQAAAQSRRACLHEPAVHAGRSGLRPLRPVPRQPRRRRRRHDHHRAARHDAPSGRPATNSGVAPRRCRRTETPRRRGGKPGLPAARADPGCRSRPALPRAQSGSDRRLRAAGRPVLDRAARADANRDRRADRTDRQFGCPPQGLRIFRRGNLRRARAPVPPVPVPARQPPRGPLRRRLARPHPDRPRTGGGAARGLRRGLHHRPEAARRRRHARQHRPRRGRHHRRSAHPATRRGLRLLCRRRPRAHAGDAHAGPLRSADAIHAFHQAAAAKPERRAVDGAWPHHRSGGSRRHSRARRGIADCPWPTAGGGPRLAGEGGTGTNLGHPLLPVLQHLLGGDRDDARADRLREQPPRRTAG